MARINTEKGSFFCAVIDLFNIVSARAHDVGNKFKGTFNLYVMFRQS